MADSTFFLVVAIIALVIQTFLLVLALFEPNLPYKISSTGSSDLESEEFLHYIDVVTDAHIHRDTIVEVLTNGEAFYQKELEALRSAQRSINLEAYIFQRGKVGDLFVEAFSERAAAGVKVKLVLDTVGSLTTPTSYFAKLIEAGGQVAWYHPLRWHTWPRINNRTHRELIIVDGEVAFIGGAGIADQWFRSEKHRTRWRDTMFRVTGAAVTSLQACFAENWLESSGEILLGPDYYRFDTGRGQTPALVVNSSPSAGRSTRARILFQTLLASAQKSIYINTPYFLPDFSARQEMIRAIEERGVRIEIVLPGKNHDHLLTRRSSRRLYGDLLKAGASIYEYQPAMMHAKVMIIDGVWSVIGSTNFDHRSFGLNDEVNLAAYDREPAVRLEADFVEDRAKCQRITYDKWRRRPILERFHEWLGWILERQQ